MKKILIIDDKAAELEKAAAAARSHGWEAVTCNPSISEPGSVNIDWIELIPQVDGVATDLMWSYYEHGEKPMGLLVVIEALSKRKPIVICTNASDVDRGHHGEAMGFIHDGYYTSSDRTAFGLVESKDWDRAMNKLAQKMT